MPRIFRCAAIGLMGVALGAAPVFAQSFSSGSTGADGAFTPPTGVTTLTLPPSGVFNFTTVTIAANATVKFTRNAANTPVTMLASGNVTIAGVIDVSGAAGGGIRLNSTIAGSNGGPGGPGGFDGGSGAAGVVSTIGGAGLGAGGGTGSTGQSSGAGGAGHLVAGATGVGSGAGGGGAAYGTASLLPLVGGSGGGGGGAVAPNSGGGGGGGGGALLIASSGTINLTGQILAQGGNGGASVLTGVSSGGGGSAGSVRLIATTITGTTGTISVAGGTGAGSFAGGNGSAGRIRVETFTNTLAVNVGTSTAGVLSSGAPSSVTLPNAPSLRVAAVGGVPAPAVPSGSFTIADVVLPPTTSNPVTVSLAAANIPVGTTVTVTVKGLYDAASSASSSPLAGSVASSTASANVTIPTNEPSIVGAFVSFTLASVTGGAPVYVDGEEVERVRVTAAAAGPSTVAYVTRAGREISISTPR
jgi:hypothetical protein